ncbi:L-glutaminase [Bacillus oleivorans]|uniref:Glutaminase n=1 Tax=Bacillus oleivorans TaxID=1448271 RepID=A0A285D1V2_9BACI|nr:glutaminase A [Bacillus oleivorans]SNX73288.1 L-glutaminase [Bacillus oleivorans]
MTCQASNELEQLVLQARPYSSQGKLATYIPALEKANPSHLSVAIFHLDGTCTYAGDYKQRFSLQSISKVLSLAYVLARIGDEEVFQRVGMEPTGDPFNSIAKLETTKPSKPLNPMINAGALVVTSLIPGADLKEQWEDFLDFIRTLTGNPEIAYNKELQESEFSTSYLNRALCFFMKQHGIINGEVEKIMELYTKQCSIEMNCLELAQLGAVFANNGRNPVSGEQIIPVQIARICKTFMVTCGMYNASGEFAMKVGIPAKSGVSGGILGVIPNRCGIGVFSPALDEKGNSLAGWKLLEFMNEKYNFSIF